jgi:hypothetical protein
VESPRERDPISFGNGLQSMTICVGIDRTRECERAKTFRDIDKPPTTLFLRLQKRTIKFGIVCDKNGVSRKGEKLGEYLLNRRGFFDLHFCNAMNISRFRRDGHVRIHKRKKKFLLLDAAIFNPHPRDFDDPVASLWVEPRCFHIEDGERMLLERKRGHF